MTSKLSEGGFYVEVNKEDLAGAPLGVPEFLLSLYRKGDRKTETGLKTQQEQLGQLIKSLTNTISKSAEQHPVRGTTSDEAISWSDTLSKINAFVAVVNTLEARQNGDLGPPVEESLQKANEKTTHADDLGKVRAEVRAEMETESSRLRASREASALSFDYDVIMVGAPSETADSLTQSLRKVGTGTKSAELPPKRKNKEALSPEILAKELTNSGAIERIRRHVLTYRDIPSFPKSWDKQRDWAEQTYEILNLAQEWDEKSEFSKLVSLILRTHGVERIFVT